MFVLRREVITLAKKIVTKDFTPHFIILKGKNPATAFTASIYVCGGAVSTICKHIIANEILPRRGKGIRIDESASAWVVVSGLQVVEPGFSVVVVAVPFVEVIISHFKSLRKMENEPNFTK